MAAKNHTNTLRQKGRTEITDSSGWTHVLKGRRKVVTATNLDLQLDQLQIADPISLEEVSANHERCVSLWEESKCWKTVVEMLQKNILSDPRIRLTNCVCLGLGSLSTGKASSRHEMAALVTLLRLLGKTYAIEKVIFQDPAFNEIDKVFLNSLGYHVVSSPSGFEQIDKNTFCFAPHLEHDVFAMALKATHPGLCVGNSNVLADRPLQSSVVDSKDTLEVFRTFIEATSSNMMPEFHADTWCLFTSIYWLCHPDR